MQATDLTNYVHVKQAPTATARTQSTAPADSVNTVPWQSVCHEGVEAVSAGPDAGSSANDGQTAGTAPSPRPKDSLLYSDIPAIKGHHHLPTACCESDVGNGVGMCVLQPCTASVHGKAEPSRESGIHKLQAP